jgi:hypothetical protein
LTPGSGICKNIKIRIRDEYFGSYFLDESLEKKFWVKILKFFDADADPDPRSENLLDPGSGMKNSDPQH